MEIRFKTQTLDQLETDKDFTAGFSAAVVRAYRKRIWSIRAAVDERDLYTAKGNHFEKLQGSRQHQHSLRLNGQMRLIVEIEPSRPKNIILVVGIEDYH